MERLEQVRSRMAAQGLDALLINKPENRVYLTGFTGSAGVALLTASAAHLLVDFRYTEQAKAQAAHFTVLQTAQGPNAVNEQLLGLLHEAGAKRVGFEGDFVSYDLYDGYQRGLAPLELVSASGLIEGVREVKDQVELALLKKAAQIADAAFEHILGYIEPGLTEIEVAVELENFMRRQGAEGTSFATIVASGVRSSLPHGVASDKVIEAGDFITFDFGCRFKGYCSDMTRTIVIGEPDEKQQEIYEIVLEAQQRGLAAVRPGVTAQEVDNACRSYIAERGYGEYFGHSTGHGVGLYIHEGPRLGQGNEAVLQEGMVVTIEPGIYLPGWGGVRIEDLVVVTADGCERLSHSPKELIILEP